MKGIYYRLYLMNINVIQFVDVDCCVLVNNYVVDWGFFGFLEILDIFEIVGIKFVGVGRIFLEVKLLVVFQFVKVEIIRVLVFVVGYFFSGVFDFWQVRKNREGVNIFEFYEVDRVVSKLKE